MRDDRLVVFAGAGVSMGEPANLPSFGELAQAVAQGTGQSSQDDEQEDRFLGRLQSSDVNVHARVAEELSKSNPSPTDLHHDLLRMYSNSASVCIVTTNFDTLFEQAAASVFESKPNVFTAPALPLGRKFNGIVHVHGSIECTDDMVLTDKDFGRAYLTEGWARRFLVELFGSFTVLFVGYNHSDIVMTYLARALPTGEATRFALIYEDIDRWRLLGIEPVMYPKSGEDNHQALKVGIAGLAKYATRGVLDWQREIQEVAANPPSLDDEAMDLIEDALSDETKSRFFTNAASHAEWIGWLDGRNQFGDLFDAGSTASLGTRDRQLASWLAEKFTHDHSDVLFLLIARHGMRLHPEFWSALGRRIGMERGLDTDILSRWVSLLVETAPPLGGQHVLHRLGKRCIDARLTDCLVDIFGAMAENHLMLESDSLDSQTSAQFGPVVDHYTISELWENGLRPILNEIAEPLLAEVAQGLTKRHRVLRAWQSADENWDSTSYGRSAIEPHEQDRYHRSTDVVIDAGRDCLEHLAREHPEKAACWCDRLVAEESPLLRRLAVHTLSVREDLTADERADWLLATVGLHDFSAHHEIHLALLKIYPEASQDRRRAIIQAIFDDV